MKLLFKIIEILKSAEKFEKSNNFYFQKHICLDGNEVKTNFEYKIKNNNTDEIAMFGYCDKCKTVFHNKDFEANSF